MDGARSMNGTHGNIYEFLVGKHEGKS